MKIPPLVLIGLLFLLSVTAARAEEKNVCILAPEEIESENAFGWKPRSTHAHYEKDPDGTYFIYHRRRSYEKNGMTMSIYTYFGRQFGFKAWACNDNQDPLTWDTPSHGIAIRLNDGTWHNRVPAQKPDSRDKMYDKTGKLIGILITFDKKEVFIRRKN